MIIRVFIVLFCTVLFFNHALAQTQAQLDSLEKLIPTKKGKEKLQLLNDMTFYYFQANPQKAIKFGEQALTLAKQINDKKMLANTYNDYSMPFLTIGNFEKTVWLNKQALSIRKELKDSAGMISSYSKLGNAYFELGQYSNAQTAYNEVIKLAKLTGDEVILMKTYQNSANVLELSGFVEEALEMQKDVQALAKKLKDRETIIFSLGNMGSCYRKLKQYEKSRECYLKAKSMIEKTDNPELLSIVYQGLGVVEKETGNIDLSLDYYKKAFAVYKRIDSQIGMGTIAGNIGGTYAELKDYDSAIIYLNISLDMVLKTKSYRQIANTYQKLGEVETRRNNYKKAVHYLQLENNYKDSVMLHQGGEDLAEMFTKYQLEKKEREIAENKAQISEGKFQKLLLSTLAVGLCFLLLIIFFYFRRKRIQAQAELERTKNEEKLLRERQLNEQKLEISRELHDNIGSQITYMISSIDNIAYGIVKDERMTEVVKNLSDFGRETMKDLRSTVWAMNTEDGSLSVLLRKIEDLRLHIPITLVIKNELDYNPELKAIELLNLFRIAQESIQNALKYAHADEFTIRIYKKENVLFFEFSDNGSGFEITDNINGNGLLNMEHRCKQIGGDFNLESQAGKGTIISCSISQFS